MARNLRRTDILKGSSSIRTHLVAMQPVPETPNWRIRDEELDRKAAYSRRLQRRVHHYADVEHVRLLAAPRHRIQSDRAKPGLDPFPASHWAPSRRLDRNLYLYRAACFGD